MDREITLKLSASMNDQASGPLQHLSSAASQAAQSQQRLEERTTQAARAIEEQDRRIGQRQPAWMQHQEPARRHVAAQWQEEMQRAEERREAVRRGLRVQPAPKRAPSPWLEEIEAQAQHRVQQEQKRKAVPPDRQAEDARALWQNIVAERERQDRQTKPKAPAILNEGSGQRGLHGFQSFTQGGPLGLLGSAGLAGAAVAAGAQAAIKGVEMTAQGLEVLNNSFMTTAQKADALTEAFIPGAHAVIAFRDALNGVNERIRQADILHARQSIATEIGRERYSRIQPLHARAQEQHALSQSLYQAAGHVPGMPTADRSTYLGEIEYHEQARMRNAQLGILRAEAGVQAARSAAQAAAQNTATQTREQERLQRAADRAIEEEKRIREAEEKRARGPSRWASGLFSAATALDPYGGMIAYLGGSSRDKGGRHESGLQADTAIQRAQSQREITEAAITAEQEKRISLAQAEWALSKAHTGSLKEQLAILQAQEQRVAGNSSRFARLNVVERRMAVNALEMVKEHGIDAVPPAMRALAERAAPQWMQKAYERLGEHLPEYKELQQKGFLEDKDLKTIRAEVDKVQAQVDVKVIIDEARMAEATAKAIDAAIRPLLKEIDFKRRYKESQQDIGNAIRNNAAH